MTILAAVAFVTTAIQFVKKVIPAIEGRFAILATLLLCAAVTAYKYFNESLPFTFLAIGFFVQVVIGALGSYEFIKLVAPEKTETPTE
jgi:nitrate reductase NapE component